jgi:hypothetical protein
MERLTKMIVLMMMAVLLLAVIVTGVQAVRLFTRIYHPAGV